MSFLRVASRSATTTVRPAFKASSFVQRRGIITLKEHKYTATATATGAGRNGNVTSNDGTATPLELKLATPNALGGTGEGVNPEQLFASGYSACFLGALQAVAAQQGKKDAVKNASITANVHIGTPNDRPGFGIAVDLTVSGVEDQELIDAAHAFCPYSRLLNHGGVVNVKSG
ncbi:organic hydroperoxide resistance protein [Clavulina sp. PMI_390]|nr:organic hydroperoxide resistance protein [Clavulina sp. PMI_390]